MPTPTPSVAAAICAALLTADPRAKCFAARAAARDWRLGKLEWRFDVAMPDQPAWPDTPALLAPSQMPKRRKGGSESGRLALWHALAHIEFVAIDLALDMAGRFGEAMGHAFVSDFLAVAADEAMHFALLARKLEALGSRYARCPPTPGCGKPRTIPATMSPRGWRWCQWCSKRAGLTSPRPCLNGCALRVTKTGQTSSAAFLTTKFATSESGQSTFCDVPK